MHTTVLVREKPLPTPLPAVTAKPWPVEKPLRSALRKANIEPFTKASVREYKRQKLWEFHQREPMFFWNRLVVRFLAKRPTLTMDLEILFLFGTTLAWGLTLLIGSVLAGRDGFREMFANFGVYALPVCTLFVAGLAYGLFLNGKTSPYWERVGHWFYPHDKIPDRVKTTMDEISFHCPGVEYDVEKVEFRSVEDPFLIARLNSEDGVEEYYVDVWDEADFKRP